MGEQMAGAALVSGLAQSDMAPDGPSHARDAPQGLMAHGLPRIPQLGLPSEVSETSDQKAT